MSFRFTTQKLTTGLYEPEGIYLQTPFEGDASIGQGWGEQVEVYGQFQYNGIPLKGHNGVDFLVAPFSKVLATDHGRVVEIGMERGGYERYVKLEHRWGESFYAFLGDIQVDSGQQIERGGILATTLRRTDTNNKPDPSFFHFAIRIEPFNRLDGFGGFSDPLPYMNPSDIIFSEDSIENPSASNVLHMMLHEKTPSRRP